MWRGPRKWAVTRSALSGVDLNKPLRASNQPLYASGKGSHWASYEPGLGLKRRTPVHAGRRRQLFQDSICRTGISVYKVATASEAKGGLVMGDTFTIYLPKPQNRLERRSPRASRLTPRDFEAYGETGFGIPPLPVTPKERRAEAAMNFADDDRPMQEFYHSDAIAKNHVATAALMKKKIAAHHTQVSRLAQNLHRDDQNTPIHLSRSRTLCAPNAPNAQPTIAIAIHQLRSSEGPLSN
jgi:hypothetical protein